MTGLPNLLRRLGLGVSPILLAMGCALFGGQTGEGDNGAPPGCEDHPAQSVVLNDSTSLGFAAQDVLAFAEGSHELAVTTADARLDIMHVGNQARFVDSSLGRALDIENPCRGHLEIDVAGVFALNDAELAWSGVLYAHNAEVAQLHANISPSSLTGTLPIELQAGESIEGYALTTVLASALSAGRLEAIATHIEQPSGPITEPVGGAPRVGPSKVERVITVLDFPEPNACDALQLPISLDTSLLGTAGQNVVEMAATDVMLTWSDETQTTLHVGFSPSTNAACISEPCTVTCTQLDYPVVAPNNVSHLQISGVIQLQTDDERWNGEVMGTLRYQIADTGGVQNLWFQEELSAQSPDALQQSTGLLLPEASASDTSMVFHLVLVRDGKPETSNGFVVVGQQGAPTPCPAGEMCVGAPSTLKEIERGQFGSD